MPVTVVVQSGSSDAPPSLTFDGSRIVIGRGNGSDVRLPDPSVSFRHATIRASGPDYAIVDEGSTNGTFVGGIRLLPQSPRIVKSGDLVRVGRVWLELAIGQQPATPDLGLATRDLAFALVQQAMLAVGDDTVPKVRVAEGSDLGAHLLLVEEGRAYVIGRSETCDLPLADEDASREHAVVVRRGGQVLLRDLDSRNGVWLGESRLAPDRDTPWRSTTMARLGGTVLALDEPVSVALAALEAADDERLDEKDAPPAPSVASSRVLGDASNEGSSASAPPASRVGAASVGPLADIADAASRPPAMGRPRRRRGWTVTDAVVVLLAIGIIGASVAALLWVLR